MITAKYPYIASSPDCYCTCNCCPDTLFECKCSWTHRGKVVSEYVQERGSCLGKSTATSTSGETTLLEFQLYNKNSYFTQMQQQIFVCEKQEECFYVYTTKDTFTERITFKPNYAVNEPKFEHFFSNYICPELFTNKILSKIIARSILKVVLRPNCDQKIILFFFGFQNYVN